MAFRLTTRARRDLNKILRYSAREYGYDAADRYELLLTTAMEEVGNQPQLNGSRPVRRRPGIRTYAIFRSRLHVPRERRIQNPVHKLVYRLADDNVVEILAVIGDGYPATRVIVSY